MDFQSDMVTIEFKEKKMKKTLLHEQGKIHAYYSDIYIHIYILIYIFLLLKKEKEKINYCLNH